MSNKPLANPTAFTGQSPPWSLTQLDANFSAVQATINDTLTYSNYFVDQSGVANSIIISIPNTLTVALTAGTLLFVKIANTNTAAATMTVNALVAQAIVNPDGSAMSPAQLIAGGIAIFCYDGTNFQFAGTWVSPALKRTTAEIAAGITPTNFAYFEGDIRRYGALTSAANNAVAINNALLVSANGGSAAFIPAGTWPCTAALAATLTSSLYGLGQASVLAFTSSDGIVFTNQGNVNCARFFRDFTISGTTVTTNAAIKALMTAGSGNRVTGILFQNISITGGFQYMVYGYGYYQCVFHAVQGVNNTNGFYFVEQSVKVLLVGCAAVRSPGAVAGDGSVGLFCGVLGGVRAQDVKAIGCYFYAHDINVQASNVLLFGLDACDIDNCATTGVRLTTVNGGCVVRSCWVATLAATATNGILVDALGSANNDVIVIDGCQIICNTANAGSVGLSVGGNQLNVTTNSNTIGSATAPFATGLTNLGAPNHTAKNNTIYASTTAFSSNSSATNADFGPNTIQNGAVSITGPPTGYKYRARGAMSGTVAFAAATSVAVTFAENMPDATYRISLTGALGTTGLIWAVNKAVGGFTINATNSTSASVDWAVSYG